MPLPFHATLRPTMKQPPTRRRVLSLVAATLLGAWHMPASEAAVFGTDDRGPIAPAHKALAANVGVVLDDHERPVCTAFCVGPRTVATAAHCLMPKGERRIGRLQSFGFALSGTGGQAARSAFAAPAVLMAGSSMQSLKPPIDSTGDWALVRLEQPICTAGGLRLSTASAADVRRSYAARRAINFAFHKDRPNADIVAGADCRIGDPVEGADLRRIDREFAAPEHLLLHHCDTAGGASGSPIVAEGAFGPEVIAINVGTYVQSSVLIEKGEVVERTSSGPLANTAASAAPIAIALADLDADEPVTDRGSLVEMEVLLAAAGAPSLASTQAGQRELEAAVADYQERNGLAVTGTATRGLLQRLRDDAQSPASATLRRRPLETGSVR